MTKAPTAKKEAGKPKDETKKGRSRLRVSTAFLAGAGFLLVAVLAYSILVLGNYQEANERNLGLLSRAAGRIEGVVTNAERTVASLARDYEFACDFDQRQPYLDLAGDCSALKGSGSGRTRVRFDQGALFVEALDEPVRFEIRMDRILRDVPLEEFFETLLVADHTGAVAVHQRSDGRPSDLRLFELARETLEPDGEADGSDGGHFARLQQVGQVTRLALAAGSNRLFCQPLRVSVTGSEGDAAGPQGAAAGPQGAAAGPWVLCGTVPSRRLVSEALAVSAAVGQGLLILVLLGFLSWPILKLLVSAPRERFRLNDAYLLVIGTLAALMLATIVLADGDANHRFRVASVESLESLSDAVGRNLRQELGELYEQLDEYDRQLSTGGPSVEEYLRSVVASPGGVPDAQAIPVRTHLLYPRPSAASAAHAAALPLGRPATYEHFSSVFWMTDGGWQFAKASVRRRNTPAVRLDHRPYFQVAREGRLWRFEGAEGEGGEARFYYVQPFRSVTTGEHHTAVSTRSRLSERLAGSTGYRSGRPSRSGPVVVAAITGPLLSVSAPVVPPGMAFAVIDNRGLVLYHSDPRRALDEWLFDEVGDARRLRSAVASRTSRGFKLDYLARPHQMHVQPIAGLPWSVVSFRELGGLRTVRVEAFLHALLLIAPVLFAALLGFAALLLAARLRPGFRVDWLWPDRRRCGLYAAIALLLALAGLLSILTLALAPDRAPTLLYWGPLAIGVVSLLVVGFLFLRRRRLAALDENSACCRRAGSFVERLTKWLPPRARPQPFFCWYLSAVTLLWLVVAVLPAYGALLASWDDEMKLLASYEGHELQAKLDRRSCEIDRHFRDLEEPRLEPASESEADELRAAFRELRSRRHRSTVDLYLASTFRWDSAAAEAVGPGPRPLPAASLRPALLRRYKPLYNPASEGLRYVDPKSHVEGVTTECALLEDTRRIRLATTVRPVASAPTRYGWIGGGALLVALFLWVLYCGWKLFLGAIRGDGLRREARSDGAWLERELGADEEVGSIVLDRLGREQLEALLANRGRLEVRERIVRAAAPRFREIWNRSSRDEKLVLAQLAEEKFVNPKQEVAVRSLLRRGRLIRTPVLRPMSDSFELFLTREPDHAELMGWEGDVEGLSWATARWILLAALVVVLVFLFATQRGLFQAAIGFVSSLAVVIPSLIKIARSWGGGGS